MKLNKVLILALIGAAFVSRVDAYTAPRPEKVQKVLDQNGMEIENMLDVKDKNVWTRFEKNMNACTAQASKKKAVVQYEYTNKDRVALNVREKDGSCSLYVKVRELSPNEKETIMMEDVFED